MKKIFTLVAMACMALGAGAQTTPQTWDFTKTSDADIALLEADGTNWKSEAKSDEGKTYTRYASQFVYEKTVDFTLQANSTDLELAKGLKFQRTSSKTSAGSIRIDANYRLSLNSSNLQITIPELKAGDKVNIRYGTASGGEERSFNLTNLDKSTISTTEKDTQEKLVVATDGDVKITNTKGMVVYAISINEELPTSAISSITTEKEDANAPVYNLAGQRVSKDTKGVLIQNGKKFVVK